MTHTLRSIARRAAAIPLIALSACAPVDDEAETRADAVTVTGPFAPLPHQQGPRNGMRVWSYGSDPALRTATSWRVEEGEWSGIEFGDVNGDGLDDLCGWVSGRYGCSLRSATERFEGFRRVPEFDGIVTADVFNVNLHWLVDLDLDGRVDACVLDARGVLCAYATPTGFVVPRTAWGAVQPFVADFSQANGWDRHEYGSTIGVMRRGGPGSYFAPGFCGRGRAGVRCWFYNNTRSAPATPSPIATTYSDAQFWNQIQYYSTIRYVDVNGDGADEVCGRGAAGIYCTPYNVIWNVFEPTYLMGPDFSDSALQTATLSFSRPTLAWLDLDGDRSMDLCFANDNGLRCARTVLEWPGGYRLRAVADGTQFGLHDPSGVTWFENWLHPVDLDGDGRGDLCAMRSSSSGFGSPIYCARSSGTTRLGPVTRRTNELGFGAMPLHVAHLRPGAARQVCGECAGLNTTLGLADVCCTE